MGHKKHFFLEWLNLTQSRNYNVMFFTKQKIRKKRINVLRNVSLKYEKYPLHNNNSTYLTLLLTISNACLSVARRSWCHAAGERDEKLNCVIEGQLKWLKEGVEAFVTRNFSSSLCYLQLVFAKKFKTKCLFRMISSRIGFPIFFNRKALNESVGTKSFGGMNSFSSSSYTAFKGLLSVRDCWIIIKLFLYCLFKWFSNLLNLAIEPEILARLEIASASFAESAKTWRNFQTSHSTSINSFMI